MIEEKQILIEFTLKNVCNARSKIHIKTRTSKVLSSPSRHEFNHVVFVPQDIDQTESEIAELQSPQE